MPKSRPDFTDDLSGIENEVANDVGMILELANAARREPERGRAKRLSAPRVERNLQASPRVKSGTKAAQASHTGQRTMLVNVTTRLNHQTNELLTEAALRQRLKKASPASRQDITEAALQEWFERNGYSN